MDTIRVSLHGGCTKMDQVCRRIATAEHALLNIAKYTEGQAVARIASSADWLNSHRTARKRALRADRLGYLVKTFEPSEFYADLLAINRSTPERQGRAMNSSYWDLQPTGPMLPMNCELHHRLEYGVFSADGHLVGYAGMIRCGELLHVSMFLGKWDLLDDGIMYLLMREVLRVESLYGPVVLFYNRYDSGTDGLRFYKDRIGLTEQDVEWTLLT